MDEHKKEKQALTLQQMAAAANRQTVRRMAEIAKRPTAQELADQSKRPRTLREMAERARSKG